jgi:hypothetical protein
MKRGLKDEGNYLYVLVPALALERACVAQLQSEGRQGKARSGLWFPKLAGRLLPRLSFTGTAS